MHSDESILKAFNEIDQGISTNIHFSQANVVMVSKEHYAAMCDACDLIEYVLNNTKPKVTVVI